MEQEKKMAAVLEEELYQWITYASYLPQSSTNSVENKIRSLLAQGADINYRQGHCYYNREYMDENVEDAPCLVHQVIDCNVLNLLNLFLSLGVNLELKNQVSI